MKKEQIPMMINLISFVEGQISYNPEYAHVFMCVAARAWARQFHHLVYDESCGEVLSTFLSKVESLFPDSIDSANGLQYALPVIRPDESDILHQSIMREFRISTPERTNAFRLEWLGKLRKEYEQF
jgi:hypothetical protein